MSVSDPFLFATGIENSYPTLATGARIDQMEKCGHYARWEEDFALVTEHPDCDLAWFRALTPEKMSELDQTETLVLMEQRICRWHCGCNQDRMMEVLTPTMKQDPESLFGDEPKLEIRCPRCGTRHTITREALEAFVARAG